MSTDPTDVVDQHIQQRGRTLIDLKQLDDGTWIATQMDIEIEGTGVTGALALMDYCRKVSEGGC